MEHQSTSMDLLTAQLALQQQYDALETALLKRNYPPVCQKVHYYVEKYLDSQDYNTSPIYNASPSEATIDNMADIIYMQIKDDFPELIKEYEGGHMTRYTSRCGIYTLIYPLLLNELYKRRMKKYLYTLHCSPPTHGYPFI